MVRAILTDIEGTTSALSFVKDVLFPYARQHLPAFVHAHAGDPAVAALLAEARTVAGHDLDQEVLIGQLCEWIDQDRKMTPLKALQGLIWADGYQTGAFTGHVYADAVAGLRAWQAQGIALYVYSSGSIQAQQRLFAHSDQGDLTPLFSGYFDTTIGHKREVASYQAIAATIGLAPEDILFLSDSVEELDAARAAGLQTTQLVREGLPDPLATHPQAREFADIVP